MKEKIHRLIVEGDTKAALDALMKATESLESNRLQKQVISLSAQYAKWQEDKVTATVSQKSLDDTFKGINEGLLTVTQQLPEPKANPLLKWMAYAALALIVLFGVYYFASRPATKSGGNADSGTVDKTGILPVKTDPCLPGPSQCKECQDCFDRGCFSLAKACWEAKKAKTEYEQSQETASQEITMADSLIAEENFIEALSSFEAATEADSAVVAKHRTEEIYMATKLAEGDKAMKAKNYSAAAKAYAEAVEYGENRPKGRFGYLRGLAFQEMLSAARGRLDEANKRLNQSQNGKQRFAKWLGKWKQKKSGQYEQIQGEVLFNYLPEKDSLQVSYFNKYLNGYIHQGRLYNLKLSENGKILEGSWHNQDTRLSGSVRFELDAANGDRFLGKYSFPNADLPVYYWNGEKIE